MNDYWAPSGANVELTASTSVYLFVSASNQKEGVARIVNTGTVHGHISFVTASATIGEATQRTVMPASTVFFVAFSFPYIAAVISNASANIQAGYALK